MVMVENNQPKETKADGFIAFLVILWILMGILGFFTSIFCFAYNGSFMQNWLGFLTAVTLGPFYWIFFAFAGDQYCTSKPVKQVGARRRPARRRR